VAGDVGLSDHFSWPQKASLIEGFLPRRLFTISRSFLFEATRGCTLQSGKRGLVQVFSRQRLESRSRSVRLSHGDALSPRLTSPCDIGPKASAFMAATPSVAPASSVPVVPSTSAGVASAANSTRICGYSSTLADPIMAISLRLS